MLENDYDWKMLNMIKGSSNKKVIKLVTDKEQWFDKKLEAKMAIKTSIKNKIW